MAIVRFAEVNGRRIELGDAEVRTEIRCDKCGEYLADHNVTTVTMHITHPLIPYANATAHLHRQELEEYLPVLANKALGESRNQ